MVSQVVLDAQFSRAIDATSRIRAEQDKRAENLATGRKQDETRLNDRAAFVAQILSDRAADYASRKSSLQQGAAKANVAQNGLDSVSQTLNQLKAVAEQYEASSNPSQQAALQNQFNVLAQQLDNFARDSSYGNTNLISSNAQDLTIPTSDSGSAITIEAQPTSAASLGLDITSTASIDAAQAQVRAATQQIGSDAAVTRIRENFTDDLVNSLEKGAQKLVEADLNEEAAYAISAQTRGALATASIGLAAQSQRAILQLF